MKAVRCPICKHHVERLVTTFRTKGELKTTEKLVEKHNHWSRNEGVCERCFYLNGVDQSGSNTHHPMATFQEHVRNEFALLPIPLRMDADPRFRGVGVTIAFIDSGFYPHPDLAKPRNRIRALVDVTEERRSARYFKSPHPESSHGVMSACVAAGSGHLSRGFYRGIASESDLVLIKVMDTQTKKITTQNISRGIHWAIEHKDQFSIRVINISVGDDLPLSLEESSVDQAVEEAVGSGIVVVAAVGNNPKGLIVPPASAPSAIAVGGIDDRNSPVAGTRGPYQSTFGTTANGHKKPNLVAPALHIAGPLIPGTGEHGESAALFRLFRATSRTVAAVARKENKFLPKSRANIARGDYKNWARRHITDRKYVAPYYKSMEGTSVAAAIVSSIIAQMIEANPGLTPEHVREILAESAELLSDIPREQQGHGVVIPRGAILKSVVARASSLEPGVYPNASGVVFIYRNRVPHTVSLAGDFVGWDPTHYFFYEIGGGLWSCWLPRPSSGTYRYKFVLDENFWTEDPSNASKEPDGFDGWNSLFSV